MVIEDLLEKDIRYFQWRKVDGLHVKEETRDGTVADVKESYYKQIGKLARHEHNATQQHIVIREMKSKLANGHGILHEDFSENYSMKQQNEIMSAHWSC